MLQYGAKKPQYPVLLDANQQWGDFVTESRNIRRDQDRERLEKHLEHRGNSGHSYPAPHSNYRDAGLSEGERVRISQVKSATRAALGPSFHFDDGTFHRSRRHNNYQRSQGWTDHTENGIKDIPQKYIDEFNQKWHEDDEDNDADQYLADYAGEAPWRKHAPSAYPVPSQSSYPKPERSRAATYAVKRTDSGYGSINSHRRSSERPEISNKSEKLRRPQTSHRPKTSRLQEESYHNEQYKRSQASYGAEQARHQNGTNRPKTPSPGLVSTFSWDAEEPARKRRGGLFSGLFHRH